MSNLTTSTKNLINATKDLCDSAEADIFVDTDMYPGAKPDLEEFLRSFEKLKAAVKAIDNDE